jgi:GTPase SAR1 family protein
MRQDYLTANQEVLSRFALDEEVRDDQLQRGSSSPSSLASKQLNMKMPPVVKDDSWMGMLNWGRSRKRSYESVASGLQQLYKEKLLPLEMDSDFHHFHAAQVPLAYFTSRPTILLLGAYSTGKTTFIQHLLGQEYPKGRVGPEPTTDTFTAVCYGEEVTVTPGNALIYDQTLPFAPLGRFGNGFLGRLECAQMPNPVLQGVSFIDTPGVLSGEKQRLKRGYEYQEVMSWFAEQAAMIIVFFDALKSDVSDELKQCIAALEEWSGKIHVVLNKADMVTSQELLRVNGALMWNLGKVCDTPEVTKVYVGSFWDGPLRNEDQRELFEKEQDDLYRHIEQLPLSSSVQRINDLSKRARLVKAHALLMEHLRNSMPSMWGIEEKQAELVNNMRGVYTEVSRHYGVPVGDFPKVDDMRRKLQNVDFTRIRRLDGGKLRRVDELLQVGIPDLLAMIPSQALPSPSAPNASIMSQRGSVAGSSSPGRSSGRGFGA